MYDPFAKDQIGANIFAGLTGHQTYQNGATPMQALSAGLLWRYWYKNLSWSMFLWFPVFLISIQEKGALAWILPAQFVVVLFVFGVTYVSLVDLSGFKHRLWYRLWAPVQHAMPNVRRFYWYLLMYLPLWIAMWQVILFHAANVGPWWFGNAPQAPEHINLVDLPGRTW